MLNGAIKLQIQCRAIYQEVLSLRAMQAMLDFSTIGALYNNHWRVPMLLLAS